MIGSPATLRPSIFRMWGVLVLGLRGLHNIFAFTTFINIFLFAIEMLKCPALLLVPPTPSFNTLAREFAITEMKPPLEHFAQIFVFLYSLKREDNSDH